MTQSLQSLRIVDYKWAKEIGSVGCTTAKWKKHGYSAEAKKQHPWWWLYYLVKTNAKCIIEEPCSPGPAFGGGGGGGSNRGDALWEFFKKFHFRLTNHKNVYDSIPTGAWSPPLNLWSPNSMIILQKIASPPIPPLIGSSSQPPKPVDFFPGDSSEQKWPSSPYRSYLLNVTIGLCLWMVSTTTSHWGYEAPWWLSLLRATRHNNHCPHN